MKTKILITLTCLFWQALAWGQATLVKDIYPLKGGSLDINTSYFITNSATLGNDFLIGANDSSNGFELWKSDGTENGTKIIKDIVKGDRDASTTPNSFFTHQGVAYFSIVNLQSQDKLQLWRTNGFEEGTYQIWNEGYSYSNVPRFTIDTTLYILTSKYGLIIKNLTGLGLKVILDNKLSNEIYDDGYSSSPTSNTRTSQICRLNSKWIFSGRKKDFRTQSLFISNETKEGTSVLTDLGDLLVYKVISSGNYAFFMNDDGKTGRELWKTDGTAQGTNLVKNIAPGGTSIYQYTLQDSYICEESMQKVAKGIIFTANDGINGRELWFSDGTETGTKMIKDLTAGSGGTSFSKFFKSETDENVIYFTINANELWKTDGTAQGTLLVMKATTSFALQDRYATSSTHFEQNNGYLYFLANSTTGFGYDIWRSNGSSDGNIKLGTISNCESAPYFRIAGKNLFYAGSDIQSGFELWKFPLCSHTAKINIPNGTSFCPGSSVSITGEGSGTTSPFTYKWKQGTTDAGTAATLAVTKAGTYTVEVTDKEGCTVSASVDITQTTNLPVSITGTNSFCAGQNTTLTATATGGVSPYTYQWKQNSTNVGTNTTTYAASTAGSYSVNVTDSKGCTGTSAAYSVTQKPSPNVTISTSRTPALLTGESVVLSVPTASGQTYQWAKDGTTISGATNNSYSVSGAGSYTVTVIGDGCTATSSAVMVSIILANEPLEEEVGLRVSPNPTVNQAKIVLQLAQSAAANVYVLDASGRRVRTWESAGKANRHEVMLDMRSVAAGSYVVQAEAEAEGQVFTEKLVKQ